MRYISFGGYEWITQERWGVIHPDKNYVWYDDDAVVVRNNDSSKGEISLYAKYNPRHFNDIGTAKMGVGLISSTHQFEYGLFELEVMLPNLPYSWPAFWMWSWSDWPPEIDIFEAYSNHSGSYATSWFDRLFNNLFYNVKTNIHIKDDITKWDIKDTPHFFAYSDPRKNFNKFSVNWQPDKIEFIYNGKTVRIVDDWGVLKLINNHKMNVVINNSCYRPHKNHLHSIGEMRIRNFKYTAL